MISRYTLALNVATLYHAGSSVDYVDLPAHAVQQCTHYIIAILMTSPLLIVACICITSTRSLFQ